MNLRNPAHDGAHQWRRQREICAHLELGPGGRTAPDASHEPWARRAPGFFDAPPPGPASKPRGPPRRQRTSAGPAAFLMPGPPRRRPGTPHRSRSSRPVTATLVRQPNTARVVDNVGVVVQETAVPALVIDRVTKRFTVGRKRKPVTAIQDVSLRLERGDIHGILGANGSGKSTLIRLVSGLLTLDEGRVEVFGHDLATRRDGRQAADQPGQRRRRLLQEAQPDGEPPLRGPSLRQGRRRGEARGGGDPRPARHLGEARRPADRADEPGHAAEGRDRAGAADEPLAPPARRADDGPRPPFEARRPGVRRGAPIDARRDDRPHDPRPGRGGTALRPDHDPRRRPRRRRGHAGRPHGQRVRPDREPLHRSTTCS